MLSFVLYVAKNNTSETGIDKIRTRDHVQTYQQHIRQPEYQKRKVEEHLRTFFLYFTNEALRLTYAGITKEFHEKL